MTVVRRRTGHREAGGRSFTAIAPMAWSPPCMDSNVLNLALEERIVTEHVQEHVRVAAHAVKLSLVMGLAARVELVRRQAPRRAKSESDPVTLLDIEDADGSG